jgi:hypothetical protein
MLLTSLSILSILLLYFLSRKLLGISLLGEAILGFFIGAVWETFTSEFWIYKYPFMLSIGGVPIGIIFGWALVIMIASLLSRKIPTKGLLRIPVHALSITLVGGSFEYFFCCGIDIWDYVVEKPFSSRVLSWMLLGTLVLTFVERYAGEVEAILSRVRSH